MTPFKKILEALSRGKGSWSLESLDGKLSFAVGAPNAVKVQDGCIVVIGITHEELIRLRDAANELLGKANTLPPPPKT